MAEDLATLAKFEHEQVIVTLNVLKAEHPEKLEAINQVISLIKSEKYEPNFKQHVRQNNVGSGNHAPVFGSLKQNENGKYIMSSYDSNGNVIYRDYVYGPDGFPIKMMEALFTSRCRRLHAQSRDSLKYTYELHDKGAYIYACSASGEKNLAEQIYLVYYCGAPKLNNNA